MFSFLCLSTCEVEKVVFSSGKREKVDELCVDERG